jgi:hypothetical protein
MSTMNPRKRIILSAILLLLALSLFCTSGINIDERKHGLWKFAVMSDTQGNNKDKNNKSCINDKVLRAIVEDIVRENPDLVLVSGDLVNGWFRNGGTDYTAQYANWKSVMRPIYNAGIHVYPVRGNHDDGPERLALPPLPSHLEPSPDAPVLMKKAFRNANSESYIPKNGPVNEEGLTYSFTHRNAFIVGLDQFTGGQHRINQGWLNRQLAGNRNPHVFIFAHEPAFETGHKDNLAFYPKERDLFWDSIGKAGARVYFCGHDHFYNRAVIADSAGTQIRQIIAGTGGGRLRTWSGVYKDEKRIKGEYHNGDHHGYILVIIEGQKATVFWKAIIETGEPLKILDTFTYSVP